jgi:exodeoxyribonuclease VII large subunit
VSAIGHEGDRPLCDEVADMRFGTPSLAAYAIVPDPVSLRAELARLHDSALQSLRARLASADARVGAVDAGAALREGVHTARVRLQRLTASIELLHPSRRMIDATRWLDGQHARLEALSPVKVLQRGYAVVRQTDGSVVRSATQVEIGERLELQVAEGRIDARAEEVSGAG